jgi:diaminopimelate epimerase
MVRVSASQNTFIFINATKNSPKNISEHWGFLSIEDFVRHWTLGQNGLSADGLVFVSLGSQQDVDFEWHFYNCDGSSAEMCGNAARALWIFATQYLGVQKNKFVFETLAGLVSVEQIDKSKFIKVAMPKWVVIEQEIITEPGTNKMRALLIDSGVPHCVIPVENIKDTENTLKLAKRFRNLPQVGPRGTNVSFYQVIEMNQIKALSFERGVEGFTMSCGTGVIASAIAYLINSWSSSELVRSEYQVVEVEVPGGTLKASINFSSNQAFLSGDAQIDFEIRVKKWR